MEVTNIKVALHQGSANTSTHKQNRKNGIIMIIDLNNLCSTNTSTKIACQYPTRVGYRHSSIILP